MSTSTFTQLLSSEPPPPIPTTIVPIIILTYIWPACVPPRLGQPLTPGSQWWGQVWSWTQKTDSCQQSILLYDCECEPDILTLCAVTTWTPNQARTAVWSSSIYTLSTHLGKEKTINMYELHIMHEHPFTLCQRVWEEKINQVWTTNHALTAIYLSTLSLCQHVWENKREKNQSYVHTHTHTYAFTDAHTIANMCATPSPHPTHTHNFFFYIYIKKMSPPTVQWNLCLLVLLAGVASLVGEGGGGNLHLGQNVGLLVGRGLALMQDWHAAHAPLAWLKIKP